MKITMCGTAAGGNTSQPGANILLEAAGRRLLLDCGHSSVNGLIAALGPRTPVDALLFSHLHFDHVVGLPELLCRFALEGRSWPRILGPEGTARYAAEALALTKTLSRNPARELPADPAVEETPPGSSLDLGEVQISNIEVPHVAHLQCLARRLEWDGGSLVYSGDTTDAPEIMTPFAEGADVLIHECYSAEALEQMLTTFPERARDGLRKNIASTHSRVETVACIARDAGVGTLVLTHLLAEEDEAHLRDLASANFKGTIVVARPGLVVEPG